MALLDKVAFCNVILCVSGVQMIRVRVEITCATTGHCAFSRVSVPCVFVPSTARIIFNRSVYLTVRLF